ncbi:MAG: hypothetical protein ACKO3R_07665 [bacterium]
MGIFGIGKASTPPPEPEPSKKEDKKFTPEEMKQFEARASEQTTNKEQREILTSISKSLEGFDGYSQGALKIKDKLNNIPADTDEAKLPKGKQPPADTNDNPPPKRKWF